MLTLCRYDIHALGSVSIDKMLDSCDGINDSRSRIYEILQREYEQGVSIVSYADIYYLLLPL